MADKLDDIEAAIGSRPTLAGSDRLVSGPAEQALTEEGSASEEARTSSIDPAMVIWVFRAGEATRSIVKNELAEAVAEDENMVWVDLSDYDEASLGELSTLLGLDPSEVHTALSPWQRPRLDVYGGHFFTAVTVARLEEQERRVAASELDLSVGNNYLLSMHKTVLPFSARILERARSSPKLIRFDSAYMLYIVLDELLAYYADLSEHIEAEVDAMQERALTENADTFLEDLVHFRRYVSALSRLVQQHRAVFSAFLRPDFSFVEGAHVEVYFRDLEARLLQQLESLEASREAVNGAFDLYVSRVAHSTNQTIKVLTVASTMLFSISVIVGFFGTSFQGIPLYTHATFIVMIALVLLDVFGIGLLFKLRGWL